jgi:hypothetical protein
MGLHMRSLLLMLATVSACVAGSEDGQLPEQVLQFDPIDDSTGLTTLRAKVNATGTTLGGDGLKSDLLRLATWPNLETIPAMVTVGEQGSNPPSRTLEAVSTSPVPDGWYIGIVNTKTLPAMARFNDVGSYHKLSDSEIGVRLHVGSKPEVRGLTACEKIDATKVMVTFTEPVAGDWSAAAPISLAVGAPGSPAGCVLSPPGLAPRIIDFICPKVTSADEITMVISPGLSSSTGAVVGERRQVVKSTALVAGPEAACRYYRRDP